MKVLYIDPVCFDSHSNFNKLHIEAIRKTGAEVDYIFKSDYNKLLGVSDEEVIYTIPTKRMFMGGIQFRMYLTIILTFIRFKINLKNYDRIIISYYDEISLYFTIFPSAYLINHVNVSGLNNKVKLWFYRRISNKHHQIVLEPYIEDYLQSLKIRNIHTIRHGIIKGYKIQSMPSQYRKFKHIFFSPSAVSSDELLIKKIIESKDSIEFLKRTNSALVIRSKNLESISPNIVILKNYITDSEYQSIFVNADGIIITYPKSYRFRISGVLLEALACRKKTILSDIEMLRQYKNIFSQDYYFQDENQFISILKRIIESNSKEINISEQAVTDLMPNYDVIF